MVSRTTISLCHKLGQEPSALLLAAMALVERFATAQVLETALAQRLAVVVEELVCNLLDHAAQGRDIALVLTLAADAGGTLLTLEDNGDPFDPRAAPIPETPNPVRGGGVGLALVGAWCKVVSYDSADGSNRLMLRLRPLSD